MKKYLLTGLILLLPIVLTYLVIRFLFDLFTTPFLNIVNDFLHWASHNVPITPSPGMDLFISRLLALILLTLVIFFLGIVARWFFFKNLFGWTHKILSKIPLIKTVYQVSKDCVSALISTDGKKAFKKTLLFPFPSFSTFGLGLEAGEVAKEIQEKVKEPLVSVFAPTAPHPIGGFLLLIPKKDLHYIDMTNEEAFKYLVSCGLIQPEERDPHGRKTL